ncbi:dephospho-CoA kinase [Wenyingzhuangia fucanilytica]|uniref:Dephospho-CoA kinase n=1 Tax=Wenyingzhuangia fucanilytica TaxID=1790137 RepID=A0A1B1Y3Y4_9FLAO|nr:dephospho-CoA kinase [Wenyingzhuangia fucanilytica]ANW95492.1 dephospho-CoA kinase [Wenyingzhuangia fucanilytica]
MVVGLTGGIGSGKSTALKMFKSLGVPVYQADVEAKNIMGTSKEVKEDILKLLGEESYKNNQLNKTYIAQKVFNNKELLQQLNAIVHPAVHKHFKDFVAQQTAPYLVYENAILYENKSEHLCDKVIVVAADLNDRISRVMQRDQVDKQAVLARMDNQWSQEDKIKKADYVIYNSNLNTLEKDVEALHHQLLKNSII